MSRFTDVIEWGSRLAETPVGIDTKHPKALWEARGWKEFVDHMPDHKKATAAVMLENVRSRFGRLDEVTRTQNLGTFDKWIFPVVAHMAENDVIDQLVALQPMAGPVSQIVFMDIVTGKRKGRIPAGSQIWRALQGATDRDDDADELIQKESLATASNGATFVNTVDWLPVRPGTLQVTLNGVTTTDDGNGSIVASGHISAGTINYQTGSLSITSTDTGNTAEATYAYNSEGNSSIQEVEMKLTSTPVSAKVLKLKALWTEEADQNLTSMYNIKAEGTILNALTNALQYQKHRQVIYDLRARADAGYVEWDATPPPNVSYQTHKFSIVDAFETAANMIFGATNLVSGNWIIAGLQAATVIQTLPMFVGKANRAQMQGITYIGDIANKKVFVDPHYPVNEWLVGTKNDQFLSTGYVLAEYQKLYTTPDVVLTDFVHQRGFATSFAKKCVNPKMYCRGRVVNSPTQFGQVIG